MAQPTIITVHPERVLIKITQEEWESLFTVWIMRNDGSKVKLFTDMEESEGYEKRFRQNLSVGNITAIGENVKFALKGDIAIIDYLVTSQDDCIVGYHKGSKLIAIRAKTTYHTSDATPYIDGRKTYVKGDYDNLSPLLGLVRSKKLIALRPYIFLKWQNPVKMNVGEGGTFYETADTGVCVREVIAAHPDSGYKDGDKVLLNEADLFSRTIDNKQISVVFERDILGSV
jgi:hypothetical protein